MPAALVREGGRWSLLHRDLRPFAKPPFRRKLRAEVMQRGNGVRAGSSGRRGVSPSRLGQPLKSAGPGTHGLDPATRRGGAVMALTEGRRGEAKGAHGRAEQQARSKNRGPVAPSGVRGQSVRRPRRIARDVSLRRMRAPERGAVFTLRRRGRDRVRAGTRYRGGQRRASWVSHHSARDSAVRVHVRTGGSVVRARAPRL